MNSRHTPGNRLPSRSSYLALAALLGAALACQAPLPAPGPRDITVTGSDYAFQLPDSLQAGPAVLHFNNAGKVDHEMGMALLKPGVTRGQVMDRIKAGPLEVSTNSDRLTSSSAAEDIRGRGVDSGPRPSSQGE